MQALTLKASIETGILKLSLVTETFPPEINGVAMTLGRLVDGLHQRRIEVTVVAPARPNRPPGPQETHLLHTVPGIPIPRYPELRFGLPAHRSLRRLWTEHPPDCIHVATEGPLGWSALRVARRMGVPVVSSFHTNFHSYGRHYGFGFMKRSVLFWLRSFHNATLRSFVPSDDLLEDLRADGFLNLRLFARGVDTDLFSPAHRNHDLRRQWGAEKGTPVALYVGRLAGEKNLRLVIDAWQRMKAHLPSLKLVLVGDGPQRDRLQEAAPGAIFAGMLSGLPLAAHYASADAFLFASITETFGNVVTEAMASGLPVLAYDYAAPGRFIRSGENGFLAPYNKPLQFLDQAENLARRRPEWPRLGAAARETILPLSWDAIVDAYLNDLRSLLTSRL